MVVPFQSIKVEGQVPHRESVRAERENILSLPETRWQSRAACLFRQDQQAADDDVAVLEFTYGCPHPRSFFDCCAHDEPLPFLLIDQR